MGLNMPAKTVVFTALQKWDGEEHRLVNIVGAEQNNLVRAEQP